MDNQKSLLDLFREHGLTITNKDGIEKPVVSFSAFAAFCGKTPAFARKLSGTPPSEKAKERRITLNMLPSDWLAVKKGIIELRKSLAGVVADLL